MLLRRQPSCAVSSCGTGASVQAADLLPSIGGGSLGSSEKLGASDIVPIDTGRPDSKPTGLQIDRPGRRQPDRDFVGNTNIPDRDGCGPGETTSLIWRLRPRPCCHGRDNVPTVRLGRVAVGVASEKSAGTSSGKAGMSSCASLVHLINTIPYALI